MKTLKTDLRSRYTQDMVRKRLLNILLNKPIKSITVAELCKESAITRSTFYNHFYDVYDVYEGIENEFLTELKTRIGAIKCYAFDYSFFQKMLLFISQNKSFTALIVCNIGESNLMKNIISFVKAKYVTEYIEHSPDLDDNQVENVFTYMINGAIAVLIDWIKGGMKESIEAMAKLIDSFNQALVKGLLKQTSKL